MISLKQLGIALIFIALGAGVVDYVLFVRPVALRLEEVIVQGKDQKGNTVPYTRSQLYDMLVAEYFKSIQSEKTQ